MAAAKGCSDCCSSAAANARSDFSDPSTGKISVTCGRPWVRVPVLSRTTVSARLNVSRASADLNRTPFRAPCPVPTIMATGVARPKAQGQEITKTEMPVVSANSIPSPAKSQMIAAARAMAITIGTKMPAMRSARRAMGALEPPASSTNRII